MQMNNRNKNIITKNLTPVKELKMKLSCICSVILRCILPFDYDTLNHSTAKNKKIKRAVFFSLLSFLAGLSRLNMGIYPFGLSIIMSCSTNMCIYFFCGAAISTLFQGFSGIIQFICFFLIFFIRKNISKGEFDEPVYLRIILTFFSSVFIGLCTLFTGSISSESIISFISYVIISVLCTYLFSGALNRRRYASSDSFFTLCVFALCMSLVPAFSRLSFSIFNLSIIFSCITTLWISKSKGPIYGCVCGFIMGFACSNPLYSAPFGLSGLISGYIFPKSKLSAVVSLPVVSLFAGIYLFGTKSIGSFFPYAVVSAILFILIYKYIPDIFIFDTKRKSSSGRHTAKTTEFDKVSESLSGLSAIIYKFAEHLKSPGNTETGAVFDKAFNDICQSCSMNSMCYAKRECNFQAIKNKTVSILHSRQLKKDELSEMLLNKCIKSQELCDIINSAYSELNFLTLKSNRTQTVACLYNSMSNLIKSTSENENESKTHDTHLENALTVALKNIGVIFSHITVKGVRDKTILIHGVKPDSIPCSSGDLSEYLSRECRVRLSEPSFDISDSADMVIKFTRGEIISLEYAQCCKSKSETDVNGDTVSLFESDKGYFYSIIADGMGSGKAAAATSRLSCVFLEKMLTCGTSKNVCLEMLNNLLMSKNDETFSTVDILEIDKLSSSAYFIKAGAAPSFVLRKNHLYKISSETPPVGIIPAFSAESTRFNLEKGDIIFMMSDGVMQSDADAVWLSELIGIESDIQPALLASQIIERARCMKDRIDDTSACVIKII